MTNEILDNYKQSLMDLQELNEELFYSDLKKRMETHMEHLQSESKKVNKNMESMEQLFDETKFTFQDQIKETTFKMNTVAENIDETIKTTMEQETDKMMTILNDVYEIFRSIADEQRKFYEEEFIIHAEKYLNQNKLILTDLQKKIFTFLDSQAELEETKKSTWMELISNCDKQNEIYHKKVEKIYNEKLLSAQFFFKQSEQTVNKQLEEHRIAFEVTQQQAKMQHDSLQTAFSSSAHTYEVKLSEQQDVQAANSEKLATLINIENKQRTSMKKWVITLTGFHIATIGTIVGLYFF